MLKRQIFSYLYSSISIHRVAFLISRAFFIPFLLLACSSCGSSGHSENVRISKNLADEIVAAPPPATPDALSVEQRVYIDHSESMNGFIGDRGNTRTIFDEFIDAMPDVLPGCNVFRYGQPSQRAINTTGAENTDNPLTTIATPAEFDNRLHNRSFYKMGFNPDDLLINSLAAEQNPILSILITDGVESDADGKVNTRVVNAIRSWMNQGKIFGILCLRSHFTGPFYSERLRGMIGSITVEERPFYAFVLSPNKREFDDLYQKLRRRFDRIRAIVFSDNAISCRVEMPLDISASYASEQPPSKPYYWQMITLQSLRPESEEPFAYKLSYEVDPNYPVKSLGLRLSFRNYKWDDDASQYQKEAETQPLDDKSNLLQESLNMQDNKIVQLVAVNPRQLLQSNSERDYGFYSFDQSPYVKDISDEVAAMSTRDDGVIVNADKTYRFQELIYALVDVHLKDRLIPRISPSVYFTVAYR